jgi:PAS domain S-box-containing protein
MSPSSDSPLRSRCDPVLQRLKRLHLGAGMDRRIVAVSLVFGVFAWIVDAILESAFFYDASVIGRLWADVSAHILFMRTTMVASILAFGVIAAWLAEGLRERERDRTLFRTLLDEANDAVFVIDDGTGAFVDVNETAAESLGYEREELLEMGVPDVSTTYDTREEYLSSIADPDPEGESAFEDDHVRADGTTFPVEISASTKTIDDRVYRIAVARDVTERKARERARRESRQAFEDLFHGINDGVFVHDLEGRFLAVNQTACERLGYDEAELLEMGPRDIDSEEHAGTFAERLRSLEQSGTLTFETVHVTRSGDRIPVEISSNIVEYYGQRAVLSVARDVTERKERERQRRRFEQAVEGSTDLLAATDTDNTVLFANRRYREFHEIPRDAIGEITLPEALGEETFAAIESRLERVDEGATVQYETERVGPDGTPRTLDVRHYPLRDQDGSIEGAVTAMRDVTDRKRRERAARRFRRAAESAGHAFYITDRDGTITYVNPAFETITGYSADEAIGRNPRILNSGEMPDGYFEDLWDTVLSGEVWDEVVVNERKSGDRYHANQTIAPIEGEDGSIEEFVAVQTDISEQKETERQLKHYRQAVESSTDMLAACDTDYNFVFANRRYREVHDFPAESDLRGASFSSVQGEALFDEIRPHVDRALQGDTVQYEMTRTDSEGDDRTLDVEYSPLRDADGDILGVVASLRDVTERKERRDRIARLSEYRRVASAVNKELVRADDVREMLPNAAEIIASSDLFECTFLALADDSNTEFVCESGSELEEGDVDAFHTREYFETVFDRGVYHLGDVTAAPFDQHVADRPPHSGIAISITHDGEEFGVLTIHFPPDDPPQRENVQLLEELADDIGLFLHNQTLESDLRTFKEIAERIDDPIMLQDLDGTYRVVNEAVTDYADMSRADLVGKSESAFMDDETAARIDEKRSRVVETQSSVEYEMSPDLPTIGTRTFATTRYPHYDENGDLDGTVAICRDVTERAHRETQMQVVDRVLRHTLNNKMTVIRGLAETIADAGPPSIASQAEDIVEESDRLLTTVDKERRITNLLWASRTRNEIELGELLEREVRQVRAAYPEAQVDLRRSADEPVLAHPHLGEAVGELIDNALRHNDRDEPRVAVRTAGTGDRVRIEVVDDGPGIPKMERRILIDGVEIDQLYHGSGLGLWFVYWIVHRSGGSVTFESRDDRGSIVAIDLPAASSPEIGTSERASKFEQGR